MSNTTISLRSSGVTGNTPSLGVLANGELSLNFADGILYYKTSANTLGSIYKVQPAGLTTEIQFNDGGSFGGNSAFTFNKSIATLNVTNINASSIVTGSGSGGIIAGANVIYSNTFVANTGGYFQFADGTQQTTNAASYAYSTSAYAQANTANTRAYLTALKTGDTFTGAISSSGSITGSSLTANTGVTVNTNAYITSTAYTTAAAVTQVTVDSFATTTYRSAKYEVQINTSSGYHVIELRVLHDGASVWLTQYGEMYTGSSLGTFDASISAGNLNLLFTPASATVTTIKLIRSTIVI